MRMKAIGLYMRLSLSDADVKGQEKEESNSIENQRALLRKYVESKPDWDGEIIEYIDDGYSGTNFKRPGFIRMLEDAKKGIIEMILVKDLSRLGRDYIGVGDYLEQIFPTLGIRVIAVNSNYDSNNYIGKTLDLDVSLDNLVNTMYVKDLSKKIHSAYVARWKNGINTASKAPFGYYRNPDNPREWLIDKEAAKIIKTIFKKAAEGYNTKGIVEYLNKRKMPTPAEYFRQQEGKYPKYLNIVGTEAHLWDTTKVNRVLRNESYMGSMVHGKNSRINIGGELVNHITTRNEQIIVENDHVPIVSKELFDKAQLSIRTIKVGQSKQSRGDILTGIIKCGNCKLHMLYTAKTFQDIYCPHSNSAGSESKCNKEYYDAQQIELRVSGALKHHLRLMFTLCDEFQKSREEDRIEGDAIQYQIKKRMEVLENEKIRQYESYANGHIKKDAYIAEKERLNSEYEAQKQKYETMLQTKNEDDNLVFEINRLKGKSSHLFEVNGFTRNIAKTFIHRVYIYSMDKIEIEFKFEDLFLKLQNRIEKEGVAAE